jgi:hypothetical protein
MELAEKLEEVTNTVVAQFSALSHHQLNWKPEPSKWSIAQCLDHLITSNRAYFPVFDDILNERYQLSFLQRLNPFKKTFGPMMIKSLGPQPARKFKAPKIFEPSASELPAAIVQNFIGHQGEIKNYFHRLQRLAISDIVMASPVTGLITYTVSDALQIIAGHEQRHINQALTIFNHPNFPES